MTDKNDTLPDNNKTEDIIQDNFSLKDDKKKDVSKDTPNYALRALLILLLFLGGFVSAIYFLPTLKERLPIIAEWIGENDIPELAEINDKFTKQQIEIAELTKQTIDQEKRLIQLSNAQNSALSEDLENRISALEEGLSIEPLENGSSIDTSQSSRIDMLLSRMSQLEASFIPLSKNMMDSAAAEKEREALRTETLSLTDKIALLENRLGVVEAQAARDNSGLLLNIKIAELKKKVVSGEVYEKELNSVKRLIERGSLNTRNTMTDAIERLEKSASAGLVTPAQLRRTFNDIIPELITANNSDASASWWQNTMNKLQNMITVRRTEQSSNDNKTIDGLINDIENWLGATELKPVLRAIDTLPNALQQLLSDWKTDVEDWINSEEAIETLETTAAESYLVSNMTDGTRVIS